MRKNVLIGRLGQSMASSSAVQSAALLVDSPEFQDGQAIPRDFTADASNLFPTIGWSGVPPRAQTLVMVIEDPDAPLDSPFVHGIFYNIPPDLIELREDSISVDGIAPQLTARGVMAGKNSRGNPSYTPPSPPVDGGPHHYHFQLFAIDETLTFNEAPEVEDIKMAIDNHVIACGEIVGVYQR
jgi:Raf kinase inhibitor-like YbhB/YbcL family protein